MLLAGILALWMPLSVPASAGGSGIIGLLGLPAGFQAQGEQGQREQAPSSSSAQTGSSSAQAQPSPSASNQSPATAKSSTTKKRKKKSSSTSPADLSDNPPKKIVTHGSTEAPPTHLSPSMTDEQTAKTRASNTDLLNQASSNLQKINGRSLTPAQQETADQIKKFMEQAKAADQDGDLQRAGTLANKAKLLSDSLEENSRPK